MFLINKLKLLLRLNKQFTNLNISELPKNNELPNIPWWGKVILEPQQSYYWQIGNIIICADREEQEVHIASYMVENKPAILSYKSLILGKNDELSLVPGLADKRLVTTLEEPLYLAPRSEVLLYVATPCTAILKLNQHRLLQEPTIPLKETWFGPNNHQGEMCWFAPNAASTKLTEVATANNKVISPIIIRNHGRSLLLLNQLSIPLPLLSTFSAEGNYLWTEQLIDERGDDGLPNVQVTKGPPKILKNIKLLSEPYESFKINLPFKLFNLR